MAQTVMADMIDPEVMADMISAKVENAIVVTPFAKIDNSLVGTPGTTITVPRFQYIGDAFDSAEGESIEASKLKATNAKYTVKKAAKAVNLTDEAILSGYGNPRGEATTQISVAIASKVDTDAIDALTEASRIHNASGIINYAGIVNAIDMFEEEVNTSKVMFINPHQLTQLRKDSDFISADKYKQDVILKGEVGMIANTRIVPSRRVKTVDETAGSRTVTIAGTIATGDVFKISGYKFTVGSTATATAVAAGLKAAINADTNAKFTASNANGVITLTESTGYYGVGLAVAPVLEKESESGTITGGGTYSGSCVYKCPIVKLEEDERTEDDIPALTIFMKKDTAVETERHPGVSTDIVATKHYVAALTNDSKVVIAKFKSVASD